MIINILQLNTIYKEFINYKNQFWQLVNVSYMLSIYDKSDSENIAENFLTDLVEGIQEEVEKMEIALGVDKDLEEE